MSVLVVLAVLPAIAASQAPVRLEDELAEGNKVTTRWVMRGTQGTRKMDVTGMDIFLIENGKIREIWVNMDTLAQAQQLGMTKP